MSETAVSLQSDTPVAKVPMGLIAIGAAPPMLSLEEIEPTTDGGPDCGCERKEYIPPEVPEER